MKKVLVTGAAGFIGFHLTKRLLQQGHTVIGLDNLNDYYDPQLKRDRLQQLENLPGFRFVCSGTEQQEVMAALFAEERFELVVNLAAQAGVRYSHSNPHAYITSNIVGFTNILEGCRNHAVKHLVYASSSSVYGANTTMPFSTHHNVDHPISLYAATKKSNELMAHTYSALYGLPTTGLRFFTVYGPWGRPDMAYFKFTRDILNGTPIDVYNHGMLQRDFTYIDDIVEGIVRVCQQPPSSNPAWDSSSPDPATSFAPYRLYNIGNNQPVALLEFIETLEQCLGKKAIKNLLPMQPGDVKATFADVDDLMADTGFKPSTSLAEGLGQFVEWYHRYQMTPTFQPRLSDVHL